MASIEETCDGNPDFAIICSFIIKFGNDCGVNVTIPYLQQMLEDTKNDYEDLVELHCHLLRRGKKRVTKEKWEKSVIKFCHEFSYTAAWELERFGYKKAKLSVKFEILKHLLELQFDSNVKFKTEVNKNEAESLRIPPVGRDINGQMYWYQLDKEYNMRLYRQCPEDVDNSWQLICSTADHLRSLLNSLENFNTKDISKDIVPKELDRSILKMDIDTDDLRACMSETRPNTIIIKSEKKDLISGMKAIKSSEIKAIKDISPTTKLIDESPCEDISEQNINLVKPERKVKVENETEEIVVKDENIVSTEEKMDIVPSETNQPKESDETQCDKVVETETCTSSDSKTLIYSKKETTNSVVDLKIPEVENNSVLSKNIVLEKMECKSSKIKLYEKWSNEKKITTLSLASSESKVATNHKQSSFNKIDNVKEDLIMDLSKDSGSISVESKTPYKKEDLQSDLPMDLSTPSRCSEMVSTNVPNIAISNRKRPLLEEEKSSSVKEGKLDKKSPNSMLEAPRPFKKKHLSMVMEELSPKTSDYSRKSVIFEVKNQRKDNESVGKLNSGGKPVESSGISHLQALQNMCSDNHLTNFKNSSIHPVFNDKTAKTPDNGLVETNTKSLASNEVVTKENNSNYTFSDIQEFTSEPRQDSACALSEQCLKSNLPSSEKDSSALATKEVFQNPELKKTCSESTNSPSLEMSKDDVVSLDKENSTDLSKLTTNSVSKKAIIKPDITLCENLTVTSQSKFTPSKEKHSIEKIMDTSSTRSLQYDSSLEKSFKGNNHKAIDLCSAKTLIPVGLSPILTETGAEKSETKLSSIDSTVSGLDKNKELKKEIQVPVNTEESSSLKNNSDTSHLNNIIEPSDKVLEISSSCKEIEPKIMEAEKSLNIINNKLNSAINLDGISIKSPIKVVESSYESDILCTIQSDCSPSSERVDKENKELIPNDSTIKSKENNVMIKSTNKDLDQGIKTCNFSEISSVPCEEKNCDIADSDRESVAAEIINNLFNIISESSSTSVIPEVKTESDKENIKTKSVTSLSSVGEELDIKIVKKQEITDSNSFVDTSIQPCEIRNVSDNLKESKSIDNTFEIPSKSSFLKSDVKSVTNTEDDDKILKDVEIVSESILKKLENLPEKPDLVKETNSLCMADLVNNISDEIPEQLPTPSKQTSNSDLILPKPDGESKCMVLKPLNEKEVKNEKTLVSEKEIISDIQKIDTEEKKIPESDESKVTEEIVTTKTEDSDPSQCQNETMEKKELQQPSILETVTKSKNEKQSPLEYDKENPSVSVSMEEDNKVGKAEVVAERPTEQKNKESLKDKSSKTLEVDTKSIENILTDEQDEVNKLPAEKVSIITKQDKLIINEESKIFSKTTELCNKTSPAREDTSLNKVNFSKIETENKDKKLEQSTSEIKAKSTNKLKSKTVEKQSERKTRNKVKTLHQSNINTDSIEDESSTFKSNLLESPVDLQNIVSDSPEIKTKISETIGKAKLKPDKDSTQILLELYNVMTNACRESKMRNEFRVKPFKIPTPKSSPAKPFSILSFSMDTTDDLEPTKVSVPVTPLKKKRGRLRTAIPEPKLTSPSKPGKKLLVKSSNAAPVKTSKTSPTKSSNTTPVKSSNITPAKKAARNSKKKNSKENGKDNFNIPEGFLEILSHTQGETPEPAKKSPKTLRLKISTPSVQSSESESTPIKRSRRIQAIHQKKMSELAVEMEKEQRIIEQMAKKNSSKRSSAQDSSPQPKGRPKSKFQPPASEETILDSKPSTRKMKGRSRNMTKLTLLYEDESKDSEFSTSRETEKSKRRRRGRGSKKLGYKPWDLSSESESSIEEITEEEEEEEEHEEQLVFEVNEDEFACEEIDQDAEPIVVRRARTARKIPEGECAGETIVMDDKPCLKCGKFNKPEWILLCDKCDNGYHMTCLIPPLEIIPDGDWFCQPCEHTFLCEWLTKEIHSLDIVLKQREREELRKQRLAYVGISLDNVLKPEKKEKSDGSSKEEESEEEEEDDEDEESSKSRRRSHKVKEESSDDERHKKLYGKRSVRARRTVNYQFKEYDALIASALQEETFEEVKLTEDEDEESKEDEKSDDSDKPFKAKIPRTRKRRSRLNDLDFSDEYDSGEEYKGSSASEPSAPPSTNGSGDDSAVSGRWRIVKSKSKKTKRKGRKGRRSSDEEWDEEDGSDSYRPTTRRAAQKAISYREISSEDEEWGSKPKKVVTKRKKDETSEDSEASYVEKKPKKKSRVKRWGSSDSSEVSDENMSLSDRSSGEDSNKKWKSQKNYQGSRIKLNINKKVLSSDEDEESQQSLPKKQPKKNRLESSEEEEEEDDDDEEDEDEEEEEESSEEEIDSKKDKETKQPKTALKPTLDVAIPEAKSVQEKTPVAEIDPPKVVSGPNTVKTEPETVASKVIAPPPMKEKAHVVAIQLPMQDKAPPIRTVKKDATKMVPCVIPYDKSPKSSHGAAADDDNEKDARRDNVLVAPPKPIPFSRTHITRPPLQAVIKPHQPLPSINIVPPRPPIIRPHLPVPDRRPFKSSIVQPFSNIEDDGDSDDEPPVERIPSSVPNPPAMAPMSFDNRDTKYTPAKVTGFTYAEEKGFPSTYSPLAQFQDYTSRPSPLKPSLVESYSNTSSPSKLTPLDTYSQSNSPKGFISLDTYTEPRKKKHFYGNSSQESDSYQGGEIRFPPETYPCSSSSPSGFPQRGSPIVRGDPGTPPRFHSQYPDSYAPPRSPEFYQNHQYQYPSEERRPSSGYQPNFVPPEQGHSFAPSNPYVATPVPPPNGGFMIDTLLRARNEGEEDELTGVTDIVSYITQE